MRSDNSGDAKIKEGGGVKWKFFKILNGYENIDPNIFSKIMTCERPRGIGFMLVKCQSRLDVRKYSFPRGLLMILINCQLIACIIVVLITY